MRKSEIIIVFFIIFTVILIVAFSYMADRMSNQPPTPDQSPNVHMDTALVKIACSDGNTSEFEVEIADTPEEHTQGLMNRSGLAADSGMLFIFYDDDVRQFWMENTLIPLDMVFIGYDGKIVDIHQNATPLSREVIKSSGPCRYVLEINGGACQARHISVGDLAVIEY